LRPSEERIVQNPRQSESARVRVWSHDARSVVLSVAGSLTRDSVSTLQHTVDMLGAGSWDRVVLDLRHLRSLDQTGCGVLAGLRHYVDALGCRCDVLVPLASAPRTDHRVHDATQDDAAPCGPSRLEAGSG
jgi:hypothetical protein